jgi:hypothetical protein
MAHFMKVYFTIAILFLISGVSLAQEFDKNIGAASDAYAKGNLEDTRFNLQNALRDLDIVVGHEILKKLPTSMGDSAYFAKDDNVSGMSSSLVGLSVHREYGYDGARGSIDILSDSPMLASVNAILSLPMMMNSDPDQKVIKVQGYKSVLHINRDDNKTITGYEVQVPFGKSMLTFDWNGDPGESGITSMMNTIPLADIVKLAQ